MSETTLAVRLLHTFLPGAALLGALIFAPWFWGCTWPCGVRLLTILLFFGIISWCFGVILRGRELELPPLLVLPILALLAQGWLLSLNGHTICDKDSGLLLPVAGSCPWLPGSVAEGDSRDDMLQLTALLGAGILSAWLGRSRVWRQRIWWTLAATASSIVLLGCAQRLTHAHDIFWNPTRSLDFFFATYRNVTNAGEYLNFVLPLAGALALITLLQRQKPWRQAFAIAFCVLLITGSFIDGSKMAPIITCASAVLFLVGHWSYLKQQWHRTNGRTRVLTLVIAVALLGAIAQSVGLATTWDRWSRVAHDPDGTATFSHRLAVDQVCLLAAPDAGWFGFGPGTFRAIFPYYSAGVDVDLRGVWTYAHDDYAQTLLEWGRLGAALWALYFFGGILCLARGWLQSGWKTEDRIHAMGLLQALGSVAVMAAVDFPLQIASIQLCVAVALGLAWASPKWPRERRPCSRQGPVAPGEWQANFSCAPLPLG